MVFMARQPRSQKPIKSSLYLWRFVLDYLDDIRIFSKSEEEHIEHVRQSFVDIAKIWVLCHEKKCTLMQTKLLRFGMRLGPKVFDPTLESQGWSRIGPHQKDVKNVRSFLGLANYFRKFIYGFAEIAKPMTNWTKRHRRTLSGHRCVESRSIT